MADDVAALLAYLKISKADLSGYSLGGGVALQTTIRHPALVNRLVVISAAMKHDGSFPEVNAAFDQMNAHALQIAENIKGSPLGQMYPEVHWEWLLRKIAEMESHGFDWSEAIKQIKSSTMLLVADADSIRPEHIIEFYKALGGGQRDWMAHCVRRPESALCPMPRTTTFCPIRRPYLRALQQFGLGG
jgi:pimeloyl-ACP methyl ester carboxylesterase